MLKRFFLILVIWGNLLLRRSQSRAATRTWWRRWPCASLTCLPCFSICHRSANNTFYLLTRCSICLREGSNTYTGMYTYCILWPYFLLDLVVTHSVQLSGAERTGGFLPPVWGVPHLLLPAHGVWTPGAQPGEPGQVDTVSQNVQRQAQGGFRNLENLDLRTK